MTTAPSVRSLGLALLAACALAGPCRGAEDAHALRVCPELKGAQGRERAQLKALFLGPHTKPAALRTLFDLTRPGDTRLLGRYLDAPGRVGCLNGLRAVLRAHGEAGLLWLLDRFARARPARRGRLIVLLVEFDRRSVWRLLLRLLRDTTRVPDPGAARIAPPSYRAMRVCDHALRALSGKLARVAGLKFAGSRADRTIHAMLPLRVRDRRIARFRRALRGHRGFRRHLARRPRLKKTRRASAVLAKVGLTG